ncbi:MAG: endonuclease domain-containing protein [Ignavibacteriaceae bacterium]|nr:endonuclease domain-containing protein [Ignavibacteriaceae bacterium]
MTIHYNKTELKEVRRYLRQNQTYCEKIIWMYLKNRKLLYKKFRRQYSIDYFVIDFYCPELKLAIEIDGEIHDLDEQKTKDKHRQEYIEAYGVKFLRLKNEEILGNPNKAFLKIENEIKKLIRPHP